MILPDVNVLVYAHRADMTDHAPYAAWLTELVAGPTAFACSDVVLSSFVRVVTNPRIFVNPTPIEAALAFCERLRERQSCHMVQPGPRHWAIFADLCRATRARGKLVPDAWLAALAVEHGCSFASADADFARFPGLTWVHPLAAT